MGEFYSVTFVGIQGHPSTNSYVKSFYLKYSPDGWRWSTYGYNPPKTSYALLNGNTLADRLRGVTAELKPPVQARFIELHPVSWSLGICMRVEVYGCPKVADNLKCGPGWVNNTALNACYKIGMTALPWTAARANCLLDNGDLVSITSYNEYSFVKKLLTPLRLKTYAFWIGLNSRDSQNIYRWSDGSALSTIHWLSSNPVNNRYRTGVRSCVALRTYYSAWFNTYCSEEKPYICKRKLKSSKDPKEKFTGNWISGTDYYWPLDDAINNVLAGTRTGRLYGLVRSATAFKNRQAIKFDGSSHSVIPGLAQTCISNPSKCTNGVTYSMMLNLDATLANTADRRQYLLDIMGPAQNDAAGVYVYIRNGQLGVFLRSVFHTWHSIVTPTLGVWFHFAFVWNEQNGLIVYINGQRKVNDNAGTRITISVLNDRVTDLYIGKSSLPLSGLRDNANFSMMSLAIWERSLTAGEIGSIYVYEMGGCRPSWLPYGQDCFQFNTNRSFYSNAKRDCEAKGGKLAVIPTSLQQAFLSMGIRTVKTDAYIGLNSMRRRRFFEWVDASPVLFSYWYQRKPSSYSWRRYDAVQMSGTGYGRWSDVSYYFSRAYICQRKKEIVSGSQILSYNRSATIRQFSRMQYSCPLGTKLHIVSAQYGKPPSCPYRDVLSNVLALCAGKINYCSIYVSTSSFQNMCTGVRKELKTSYRCDFDPDTSKTIGCESRWKSTRGSNFCYKLNQVKMNWTEANAYCKSKGANLVSIGSKIEEIFLTSLLIDSFELMNIWIGYNDRVLRGSYQWSDNARTTYTNWFNGQPDDTARRGSCVKAALNQGYRSFLSWTDDDCSTLNSFMCKKLKRSAVTSAPFTTTANNNSCLPGWLRYKNNCYQFSTLNATWSGARTVCASQKASLATINSIDENEAVFNFLVNSTRESAWIGLHDRGIFAGHQWTDDSPVNFVRWDSGQPDSNLGQQACVLMASNGFWRDNDCFAMRPYICKASVGIATIVPTTKALTVPVTPTANLKYCPRNWVWSSATGNCYFFSNRTYFVSWTEARSYCRSMSGDLASIESSVEQGYLEPFLLTFSSKSAWIGLSDLGIESGWEWSDGKPTTYFNWRSGQPDDWSQMEDCVQMKTGGQWDDVNCGEKASFMCKRFNNSVVIPRTIAPTAGPVKGYCEPGWIHYRSKCYKINSDEKISWNGARNVCRSEIVDGKHGELASIHSLYENAFLFSQMKNVFTKLYIGLNDIKTERKFQWSDQSKVDFTNWYSRQPDNYWGREDCVEMWPFSVHKGKWNDVQCSSELGYICQKDATSKSPSVAPTTASNDCPSGYMKYGSNCYSFKKELKTWEEARNLCAAENANSDLVSIHDAFEAAYVFSHMGEYASRVWIGLHRPKNETKFRWSNNQPFDYSEWSSYPARRMLHLDSCVYSFYNTKRSGFWVDSNCTAKNPFVCKIARSEPNIVPGHPGTCPKYWIKFDKYCYLLRNSYFGTRHWSQARQQCLDLGADLASIHSQEEQSFLYSAASKGRQSSWIGLNDRRIEKHMVWSDGTPLDYSNWDLKEPNDNVGLENCVEMVFVSGKWNDNRCSSYRGYICKKELGCDESFGMENRTITDMQIKATSVDKNNFAQNARLNSRSGWCAAVMNKNQYIEVDFGEMKRLTRIVTQGYSGNYILSFRFSYSNDGNNWEAYKREGQEAILPGNRAAYTTEGVTLETPVTARFIRINPLTWKNKICMRLEFYGCRYVCSKPLGMESGAIRNHEITATSFSAPNMPYDARFRKPNGQGWCAKNQNKEQWLQINFSSNLVTVTRVATQGVIVKGNNYAVKAYSLSYSEDGVSWKQYETSKGGVRVFSGSSFAESGMFHLLSRPFVARYVRFKPLSWIGKICMRVEVFGCPYSCDRPFGISYRAIPDKAVTASSSLENHPPSSGRLNRGSFNKGSWCAKTLDQQQYLQFDLGADSRVTHIATQGFNGDVSKYVTDFWVQFSNDGQFWSLYHANGVIQTITGSKDASTVNKVQLPSPIRARYIRLNPRHWKQGICMRVELYGCALEPVSYPTDAPIPKKRIFTGKLRLSEEKYVQEYSNTSSEQFKKMANKIETAITAVYQGNFVFKDGFNYVKVTSLKPGSIIVSFVIIFHTNDANATWPLKKAISKGKLGDFVVDKSSLDFSDGDNNASTGKSTQIVRNEGLSVGGKVALIVIFLLMIVGIIAAGLVYYFRKRGKGQFDHKSFDNPVHFTSEMYSATGERVDNLPSQE